MSIIDAFDRLEVQSLPVEWHTVSSKGYQLAALENGQMVGVATLTGREQKAGWLSSVYVTPTHRRTGVAKALVQAAAVQSRAVGHESLSLNVRDDNTAAIALYKGLGFVFSVPHEDGSMNMTLVL